MKGKTGKFAIIIMIIVSLVVSALVVFLINADNYMTACCYNYLSEKYSADKSEFALLDHDKGYLYLTEDAIPELKWAPYKWEFEYKGRSFYVNRIDGKYYDDYQLEDIESWCTNWLQQNVDERIISIEISTNSIIKYSEYKENNLYVLSNNDVEIYDFINYLASKSVIYNIRIYFADESIEELVGEEKLTEGEKAKEEINTKLAEYFEKNVSSFLCNGSIKKDDNKFDRLWERSYL